MRVILCTTTAEAAPVLLRQLLEERIVACGNIVPGVRSMYWWEGEIQDEGESLLVMEAAADGIDRRIARIRALHSYDTPKIVCLEPAAWLEAYAVWVRMESSTASSAS